MTLDRRTFLKGAAAAAATAAPAVILRPGWTGLSAGSTPVSLSSVRAIPTPRLLAHSSVLNGPLAIPFAL